MRLAPALSLLAMRKVRPTTQSLYVGVLRLLAAWLGVAVLPNWTTQHWDEVLENFLVWLYDRDYPQSTAARLPAALFWALPHLHVGPQLRLLPRLAHSLGGWRQLEPPTSRPPVPWIVLAAIAEYLARHDFWQESLLSVVMFETYLRPSEALSLRAMQIIPPDFTDMGAARHLAIVARAAELIQLSKTGEHDHTVLLDRPRQHWLVALLIHLKHLRPLPESMLWDVDYDRLHKRFRWARDAVGAHCLGTTLYCLRHGGASHDRSLGERTLAEVQERGAWKSFASVRRYSKHGRLGIELEKLPRNTRTAMKLAAQRLPGTLTRSAGLPSKRQAAPRARLS